LKETFRQHWIKYAEENWLEMDPYLKKELWTTWSLLSWLPLVWEWYDILTLLKWKDPLTWEKLARYEKVFVVIWLASWVWSWKAAKDLVNKWLEKIAKELWISLSEVLKIAEKIASEYKLSSLDDLVKLKDKLNIDKFLDKVRIEVKTFKIKKIQDIWEKIWKKYKNFDCEPFAKDFRKQLDKEWIKYIEVELKSRTRYIYSDSAKNIFPNDWWLISSNWKHYATRVWNIIYDNVHPKWINIDKFKKDLEINSIYFSDFKWLK
jgi:hypothetical protein